MAGQVSRCFHARKCHVPTEAGGNAVSSSPTAGSAKAIWRSRGPTGGRVSDSLADMGKGSERRMAETKEIYLAHLDTADEDVLRVSLADKVYNAPAILGDLRKPRRWRK
jgi:hypothetical protein